MPRHPVDVHVGKRMRQRRTLLGMSQTALGDAVGLTFQQIQKYESGGNRVGSSRLYEFAKALGVPIAYFFDDMPAGVLPGRGPKNGYGEEATPFQEDKDPLIKHETMELVRAYYKIRQLRVRRRIYEMVRTVGAASHGEHLGRRRKRTTRSS